MKLIDAVALKERIALLILEGLSVDMTEYILRLIDTQPVVEYMEEGCDSDSK